MDVEDFIMASIAETLTSSNFSTESLAKQFERIYEVLAHRHCPYGLMENPFQEEDLEIITFTDPPSHHKK